MPHPEFVKARRSWRLRWLSAIQAYADRQTQEAEWTNEEQRNPHYSYVETASFYFDDCDVKGGYDFFQQLGYVSPLEAVTLAGFHRLAQDYAPPDEGWDSAAVLADPKWRRVVGAAKKVQDRLLSRLDEPDEINALSTRAEWTPIPNGFRCDRLGSTIYLPTTLLPNAFEQPGIHNQPSEDAE